MGSVKDGIIICMIEWTCNGAFSEVELKAVLHKEVSDKGEHLLNEVSPATNRDVVHVAQSVAIRI